ncbi:unnamed protein product [Cladocopium goreaui]|uniref:Uncharacterized protein n=1 Tax=Cladocopium goreaui TaxID=2562237 RepID=A0A9P1DP17_9DINO|nr:unnamed protein product [Cladocopium goreaui]
MAGRAKENLPGGSLKYLFVYLKIRIFKCSYRIYIYLHGHFISFIAVAVFGRFLESSQFIAEKLVKYGITHPSGVTSHSPSAPEIRLRPLVAPWPPGKISVPFAPLEPPKSKYERGTEVCQTVRSTLTMLEFNKKGVQEMRQRRSFLGADKSLKRDAGKPPKHLYEHTIEACVKWAQDGGPIGKEKFKKNPGTATGGMRGGMMEVKPLIRVVCPVQSFKRDETRCGPIARLRARASHVVPLSSCYAASRNQRILVTFPGALHLELGKDALPPKPVVIWDVQTGHRRLCPAAEPNKAPESASTASTAASSADSPVPSLGAPGYLLSVAPGPNPTQRPLRHTAPGEFFAQFRRPVRSAAKDNQKRSEVLAAVTSMANEQKAMIDNILEQCDKVSRMILLATANALKESNAKAQKPMPWMTARSHIKKDPGDPLDDLAGELVDSISKSCRIDFVVFLFRRNAETSPELLTEDYPETDQTLLYCSPEERNVKAQMESFLLQSVKKFAKNQRICEFDLERVQKRLSLHSKDAEGVLNYAGHEDSGTWACTRMALAMAALKDHETGQHKIFAGFAQTLADTTSRMSRDHMGTTGFSMSDTQVSFEHVPTNAPQGAIMLQPEERDMLQGLEMQKKQKEKAVWELKRQLDELMDKRRKMDEDVAPQTSTSEGPKTSGERRLQHAKSVKEMDEALDTLDEERFHARRSIESAGPQMAKMVDFMTTGQRNLRNLLQELKRAEQKQLEVHQQLEELVWPESKTLVHDMVRNKEMDALASTRSTVFFHQKWGVLQEKVEKKQEHLGIH